LRDLLTFPLGRYGSDQFYQLQVQQRQLQDGLPRLAFRGIGEPGRPQSSNGCYCRLAWGMPSSTHRDTDANVHTDTNAHTHIDTPTTLLLRLSAAYREIRREASDACFECCPLALCNLAGSGDIPSGSYWPGTVTDRDPVPDRDAGTSHRYASAANRYATAANRYATATHEHASAPARHTDAAAATHRCAAPPTNRSHYQNTRSSTGASRDWGDFAAGGLRADRGLRVGLGLSGHHPDRSSRREGFELEAAWSP